jgi:DivIVA domain-containing protein
VAEDRRVVISSDTHLTPEEVSRRTFSTSRRGFDPAEVRTYLRRLSEELGLARERQRHLEHLLADAQNKATAPPPPLDEAALTAALGEETARVLQTAREAAVDIKAKAEGNVERLLRQAHEDAARIREESEGIYAIREAEANEAAEQIRAEARVEAEGVVEAARQEARAMLEEAKEVRAKVLGEIVRRRNVARVQVSQLRAGRERLLDAYRVVRETLDEVTDELGRAEEEARLAAEAAGQKATADLADAGEEVPVPALDPDLMGEPAPIDLGPDLTEPLTLVPDPPAEVVADEPEAAPAPEPEPEPEPVAVADEEADEDADDADASAVPGVPEVLTVVEPPSEIEEVRIIVPADEPEPEAEAQAQELDTEPEPEPEASKPVDDLFARIRAGRAEAVAKAQQVLADTTSVETAPANGTSPNGNGAAPTVTEEDPADGLLLERDNALESIQGQLAKRLKRAMQDEQNDVLDRLRVHKGRPALADALPDAEAQGARYRELALPLLQEAATAGAGPAGVTVELTALVAELADAVTGPLRDRLDDSFAASARDEDDASAVTERVGAAYREWKMQRIERLASDHLAKAYAMGAYEAVPAGTPMRWVVRDLDGPCPDCDDNALAGPTPRGDAFPTGQLHPPAHGGCRCLLVPAPH